MMQGQRRTLISYATPDPKPRLQIAFGQRKRTSTFFPGFKINQEQPQNLYSPEQYHGRSTDPSGRVSEEISNKLNKYVDATNQTDYYGILERKMSKDVRKKIPHNEFNPRRDRRSSKLDVKVSKGREMSKMDVNEVIKDRRNSKSSQETNGNRRALESEIFMVKKEETIIIVNEKRRKSKFDVRQSDTQNEVTRNFSKDSNAKYNGTRESKVINQVGGDLKQKIRMKSDSSSIVKKKSVTSNTVSARTSTLNQKKLESKTLNNLEQKKPTKSDETKVTTTHKRKNTKISKASNIDVKDVKEINERQNSKSSHRKSKSKPNVKATKDVHGSKSSETKKNVSKYKSSNIKIDSKGVKEKTKSKNGSVIGKKHESKEISSKKSSKSSKGRKKSKT